MEPKETLMQKTSWWLKELTEWLNIILGLLGFALLVLSFVSSCQGLYAVAFRSSTTGWLILLYLITTDIGGKLKALQEKIDEDYTLVPTCYVKAVIERAKNDITTQEQMDNVKSVERMVGKETTENEIV